MEASHVPGVGIFGVNRRARNREVPSASRLHVSFRRSDRIRGSRSDIWAKASHAIGLAYREPAPIGQTVRLAIALALVVAAKLCAATVLR